MTLKELEACEKDVVTASDIADIIGSDPATIRLTAKQHPELMAPLAPIFAGNHCKFSRRQVIRWAKGEVMVSAK